MIPAYRGLWLQSTILLVIAIAIFASRAPGDYWGSCATHGTCVYHSMFCEATRHGSAIRHPANSWSNVPYVFIAFGLLSHVAEEHLYRASTRAYLLLDALFAFFLALHFFASFAWHATNCTDVHWIDIAFMNNTILFFPYRFTVMLVVKLVPSLTHAKASLPSAALYLAIFLSIFVENISHTDQTADAFPTGYSRGKSGSISSVEIALYIAAPAFYPLPPLALMVASKDWGHKAAIFTCMIALPAAFVGHSFEKLVTDYGCDPISYVQPTAVFHAVSAVAIACAYVQARSLQGE